MSPVATKANPRTMADAAIAYAVQQVGKPYVWGADGPNAFDCSGLVYRAYQHAGYKFIGRPYTGTLITYGKGVSKAELAPGDLVFPDPGHVQIYIGGGRVVEAVEPGIPCRIHNMWGFWRARRLVPPGTPYGGTAENASVSTGFNPFAPFSALSSFLGAISNSHFWFRVGIGALGSMFIIMALTSKQSVQVATQTIGKVKS